MAHHLQSFGSLDEPQVLIEFSRDAYLTFFPSGTPYIACTTSWEGFCHHKDKDPRSHYSYSAVMPSDLTSFKYSFSSNSNAILPGNYRLDIHGCAFEQYTVDIMDHGQDYARYRITLSSKHTKNETNITDDSELTIRVHNPASKESGQDRSLKVPLANTKRIPIVELVSNDSGPRLVMKRIWTYCYILFTLWPHHEYITLDTKEALTQNSWIVPLLGSGLARKELPRDDFGLSLLFGEDTCDRHVYLSRAQFWQGVGPFNAKKWIPMLRKGNFPWFCVSASEEQGPELGVGESTFHRGIPHWVGKEGLIMYRRFIPEVGKVLTFRLKDYKREIFSADSIYFNRFPESVPLICEWDGIPFVRAHVHTARECNKENDTKSFRVDEPKDKPPTTNERLMFYRSLIHVRDMRFANTSSFLSLTTALCIFITR